jgi:hypothetical protein
VGNADERRRRGERGRALVRGEFSLAHEIEQVLAIYDQAQLVYRSQAENPMRSEHEHDHEQA